MFGDGVMQEILARGTAGEQFLVGWPLLEPKDPYANTIQEKETNGRNGREEGCPVTQSRTVSNHGGYLPTYPGHRQASESSVTSPVLARGGTSVDDNCHHRNRGGLRTDAKLHHRVLV
jgi:hypothetical protein